MIEGWVEFIFISPAHGEPTKSANEVHVVPGRGIEGDRYYRNTATIEKPKNTGIEITLIEQEAIDAMQKDGIQITLGETRRNVVTSGIALNPLVGHSFYIGNVQLLGIRLCEPCEYLASRTDQKVLQAMAHRGGLRAEIITEGTIHQKDRVSIPG